MHKSRTAWTGKLCSFEGCNRPHYAKDLCRPHWKQQADNQPLRPIRKYQRNKIEYAEAIRLGEFECHTCRTIKSLDQFYKNGNRYNVNCKRCHQDKVVARAFNFPNLASLHKFRNEHRNTCAICGRVDDEKGSKRFAIDHDHTCCSTAGRSCGKCIRGLLCVSCNAGLGGFRDNIELLAKAIDYLRSHSERSERIGFLDGLPLQEADSTQIKDDD
ncbi:hypothetical protein D0T12_32545 [Actinomadura spongiicola]|uniref:Recombination endonuclease VII n=1 Tax=Actinomadura spongiicola TaxID=2303421 RepID=A0A372G8F9_9ACTN|nr:hypothetical protein D0T12_32545 [Actinomadura spongiicola]